MEVKSVVSDWWPCLSRGIGGPTVHSFVPIPLNILPMFSEVSPVINDVLTDSTRKLSQQFYLDINFGIHLASVVTFDWCKCWVIYIDINIVCVYSVVFRNGLCIDNSVCIYLFGFTYCQAQIHVYHVIANGYSIHYYLLILYEKYT